MPPSCSATTRKGQPCKVAPLKGSEYCRAHDPTLPDSSRFGSPAQAAVAGSAPKPHKLGAREAMNEAFLEAAREHRDAIIAAYIDGLDAERTVVVGNGPSAFTESVPDPPTRLTAAEKLTDRVIGKPRQGVEITGADGGPIVSAALDLSALNAQELKVLRALLDKAHSG
jgi:hypothetical protein